MQQVPGKPSRAERAVYIANYGRAAAVSRFRVNPMSCGSSILRAGTYGERDYVRDILVRYSECTPECRRSNAVL